MLCCFFFLFLSCTELVSSLKLISNYQNESNFQENNVEVIHEQVYYFVVIVVTCCIFHHYKLVLCKPEGFIKFMYYMNLQHPIIIYVNLNLNQSGTTQSNSENGLLIEFKFFTMRPSMVESSIGLFGLLETKMR